MDEAKLRQAALLILEALDGEPPRGKPAGKPQGRKRRVYTPRPAKPATEEGIRQARKEAARRGIPI
jgi:hypothetical protein